MRHTVKDRVVPSSKWWLWLAFGTVIFAGSTCVGRYEPVGGKWQVRRLPSLPEAGFGSVDLYREGVVRRTRVAARVGTWFYYGSDCLAYVSMGSRRVYVQCGDRRPITPDTTSTRGEILSPNLTAAGVEYVISGAPPGTPPALRFGRDRLLTAAMKEGIARDGNSATIIPADSD